MRAERLADSQLASAGHSGGHFHPSPSGRGYNKSRLEGSRVARQPSSGSKTSSAVSDADAIHLPPPAVWQPLPECKEQNRFVHPSGLLKQSSCCSRWEQTSDGRAQSHLLQAESLLIRRWRRTKTLMLPASCFMEPLPIMQHSWWQQQQQHTVIFTNQEAIMSLFGLNRLPHFLIPLEMYMFRVSMICHTAT